MDITASVVSHHHGDQVFQLLTQLAAAGEGPRRVIATFNLPEPEWQARMQEMAWPFELMLTINAAPQGFGANHNAAFRLDGTHGANPAFAQFTQQGGGDQIIENPQTGERMRLVNGKWVPM